MLNYTVKINLLKLVSLCRVLKGSFFGLPLLEEKFKRVKGLSGHQEFENSNSRNEPLRISSTSWVGRRGSIRRHATKRVPLGLL